MPTNEKNECHCTPWLVGWKLCKNCQPQNEAKDCPYNCPHCASRKMEDDLRRQQRDQNKS